MILFFFCIAVQKLYFQHCFRIAKLVQTKGKLKGKNSMHIQVINFGINVSHEDFVSGATELAPNFASIPGLITKHWLGDEENKIYGGVYIWESKEHCEAYKAGEIFGMVMNNENHDSPTSKDFGVLEAPTKITT